MSEETPAAEPCEPTSGDPATSPPRPEFFYRDLNAFGVAWKCEHLRGDSSEKPKPVAAKPLGFGGVAEDCGQSRGWAGHNRFSLIGRKQFQVPDAGSEDVCRTP